MVITGGCLCGAFRFEHDGPVGPASYCHCADCRHVTGSAFNVGVRVDRTRFRVTRGQPQRYSKPADSGTLLTRVFCPICGSPLYTESPAHPAHIYVKAGAFDDPDNVAPAHQSWTDRAVAWGRIDPALPAYPRNRPRAA
jgi:hypothetical protein